MKDTRKIDPNRCAALTINMGLVGYNEKDAQIINDIDILAARATYRYVEEADGDLVQKRKDQFRKAREYFRRIAAACDVEFEEISREVDEHGIDIEFE